MDQPESINSTQSNSAPKNLEEMKVFIESLGIKEGTPEYASMMQEAIRTWNSPGFADMRANDEEKRQQDSTGIDKEHTDG